MDSVAVAVSDETDMLNHWTNSSIKIVPNPNQGTFIIEMENTTFVTGIDIIIRDMNGKMVKKIANGNLDKGIHSYTIDLRSLSKGVFFVNLSTKTSQHSTKIVKL